MTRAGRYVVDVNASNEFGSTTSHIDVVSEQLNIFMFVFVSFFARGVWKFGG